MAIAFGMVRPYGAIPPPCLTAVVPPPPNVKVFDLFLLLARKSKPVYSLLTRASVHEATGGHTIRRLPPSPLLSILARPFWRLLCRASRFQWGSEPIIDQIWSRTGLFFGVGAQITRFCVAQELNASSFAGYLDIHQPKFSYIFAPANTAIVGINVI